MTSMVLFTALRCSLNTCQVDPDLSASGLTPMHCATTQAAVTIQVVMGTHIGCYDLSKLSAMPWQRRDLGHAIAVSGAPITVTDRD
jgi:hypothetical protein